MFGWLFVCRREATSKIDSIYIVSGENDLVFVLLVHNGNIFFFRSLSVSSSCIYVWKKSCFSQFPISLVVFPFPFFPLSLSLSQYLSLSLWNLFNSLYTYFVLDWIVLNLVQKFVTKKKNCTMDTEHIFLYEYRNL